MITKVTFLAVILVLLAAGVLYQAVGVHRSARRYPPPGEIVSAGGQRLHLVCEGAGSPAVLFEAGIAASSLSWTRVLPGVAAFTRACAYDRPGLGWSEAARTDRSPDRLIDELRGVAAHAATGPAVLVGHSFGAFLVLAYAARYPADVAGLVLVDPPTEWQPLTPERARLLRRGIQASHLGGALARIGVVRGCLALLTSGAPGAPRSVVRLLGPRALRTLEHLVGEVRKLPPEIHPVVQALWSDPRCFRGMAEHLGALGAMGDAAARVTTIGDMPLAIVSGGDQPEEILAQHRHLVSLSLQGRHIVAEKSGHWIHLDEPDLVVGAIRDVVALGATPRAVPPSPCAS
jgi:pimeloyl-ACP methyl ester carboxylesterase